MHHQARPAIPSDHQAERLALARPAPLPHNHPWPFTSHILLGGYAENRYRVWHTNRVVVDPHTSWEVGTIASNLGAAHGTGDTNEIGLATFHEVTEIFEPGRTLSLMDCDLGRKEGWGYLDLDARVYTPNKQHPIDPRFKALLLDRNPHLRR